MTDEAEVRRELLAFFEHRLATCDATKVKLEAALAAESDPDRRPKLAGDIFLIRRRMAELKREIAEGRALAQE